MKRIVLSIVLSLSFFLFLSVPPVQAQITLPAATTDPDPIIESDLYAYVIITIGPDELATSSNWRAQPRCGGFLGRFPNEYTTSQVDTDGDGTVDAIRFYMTNNNRVSGTAGVDCEFASGRPIQVYVYRGSEHYGTSQYTVSRTRGAPTDWQVSFPPVIYSHDGFYLDYTNFPINECYMFDLYDPSTDQHYHDIGLRAPGCRDDPNTFYSSNTLGASGRLTFRTPSLTAGSYELRVTRFGRETKTFPLTVQHTSFNCSIIVSPTNGETTNIIGETQFSVFGIGDFSLFTDSVTLRVFDLDVGSYVTNDLTATLTPPSATARRNFLYRLIGPFHSTGNFSVHVFADRGQGAGEGRLCDSDARPIVIEVNPSETCPSQNIDPATNQCVNTHCTVSSAGRCELTEEPCPSPDIDPATNQCVNDRCIVSSSGECVLPTVDVAPPTTPSQTPTPQPTLPPFAVQTCNLNGQPGIQTAVGCIPTGASGLVARIFGILLGLAGGVALILIIYSGYRMMMAAGNPEGLQGARETLTAAIVGLLFIIFSFVILEVIGFDVLKIPGFGS